MFSTFSPAPAQESSSQYDRPNQAAVLDSLLLAPQSDRPRSSEELVAFSRLLSEPHDQLVWLIDQARGMAARDRAAARDLADRVQQRRATWRQRGAVRLEDADSAIETLVKALAPRLVELLDPADLKERIEQAGPEDTANLSADEIMTLLARGVAASALGSGVKPGQPLAPWDWPRVGLLLLAEKGSDAASAEMQRWLPLERTVADARDGLESATGPDAAKTGSTFDVAEALLNRAMDLDGQDCGRPLADQPGTWAALGERFEREDLWLWAASARLLHAVSAGRPDVRRTAAAAALQSLDKFVTVAGSEDAGLAMSIWRGWAASAAQQGGAVERFPLGAVDRAAARRKRAEWESALPTVASPNEAFAVMQYAKAAEVGLPEAMVAEDRVRTILGDMAGNRQYPRIHLFLEMFEVESPRGTQHYGYVIGAENAALNANNRFVSRLIGPMPSARDVVDSALTPITTPLNARDCMIIVAPDHWSSTWFDDVEKRIMTHVDPSESRSWLLYIPTAAALEPGSAWTLDATLRRWNQSVAAQPGGTVDYRSLRSSPTFKPAESFRSPAAPLLADLYPITLPTPFPRRLLSMPLGSGYLSTLMAEKRQPDGASLLVLMMPRRN